MTKEKMKTKVFNSAWKIVEEEGMSRLNVRTIAKLSECSLGSIYNCFENFESLQLHLNAAVLSDLFDTLQKVVDRCSKKTLPEVFRELGKSYIAFAQQKKFLWKALFEHYPVEPLPEWYQKQAREGIYKIAQQLAENYQIPEKEMKAKVGFFWASIHGMGAILLNRKMEMVSELFEEGSLDAYIDYCLQGLALT